VPNYRIKSSAQMYIRRKGAYYYLVRCDNINDKRIQKLIKYLGTRKAVDSLFEKYLKIRQ